MKFYGMKNGQWVEVGKDTYDNLKSMGLNTKTEESDELSSDSLLLGQIEGKENDNADAKPPAANPSALEKARNVLGYGLPLMEAGHKAAYQNAKAQGTPNWAAEAAGVGGGLAGLATDIMQYAVSPSAKIAGLPMMAASKAAPNAAAKATAAVNKYPALLGTYGKNIAANAADAAVTSNIAGNVSGENTGLHVGVEDLAAGLAGGFVKSKGELVFKNQAGKAGQYAARNNADVQFAEKQTGKKGKAAVEQVIADEMKLQQKGGGFVAGNYEGAVDRLRATGEKLDADFYKHLGQVGNSKIDVNPMEILHDIREYGIKNTKNLGMEFTKKVSDEIENEFLQQLRTIKQIRLVDVSKTNPALHISEHDAMNHANNMDLGQLIDDLGNLTLKEMDAMKRGMQGATSHYNRGAGTMERQGLQSRANKEGSEGILSHFRKQIELEQSMSNADKLKVMEQMGEISDGIKQKITDNLDELYTNALKSKGILSGPELNRYMELNKARSENIGKRKIMERAHEKYLFLEGKNINSASDLKKMLESGRQPASTEVRNVSRNALPDIRENRDEQEAKQDATAAKKYGKGLPSLKDK
jgi:hypothetical protein